MKENTSFGILYTIIAYVLWGFLPIYWKLIDSVPSGEILAHRIFWSFIFMALIVSLVQKWPEFIEECKIILKNRNKLLGITLASFIISLNWLTYIWAVNNGFVIQASLGYYINPLVSILLALLVLKEKLTRGQLVSFILAGIGVINLTVSFGVFPWISLILAFSFAIYGLLKKTVEVPAMFGLTIETLIVTPIALIYLLAIPENAFSFQIAISPTNLLLIGTGVATAVPLLLFAFGAKRIPLSMLGFLQYIAPTLMLMLGIFVYHETFSTAHFFSFSLIWIALIIYLASVYKRPSQRLRTR